MKYIRTKDKVYEVTNDKYGVFEENGVFKIHCENMGHHWDSELDVIAQADTLEELCDEMIMVSDFKKPLISENWNITRDITKTILIDSQKVGIKVYGAIWTEKGLIYVAKMNEKGELVLI